MMSPLFFMFWHLLAIEWLSMVYAEADLIMKPIPHGIDVQQRESLRYHAADWTVLVSIAKPVPTDSVKKAVTGLQTAVH